MDQNTNSNELLVESLNQWAISIDHTCYSDQGPLSSLEEKKIEYTIRVLLRTSKTIQCNISEIYENTPKVMVVVIWCFICMGGNEDKEGVGKSVRKQTLYYMQDNNLNTG
jgi:hypothetical protein